MLDLVGAIRLGRTAYGRVPGGGTPSAQIGPTRGQEVLVVG